MDEVNVPAPAPFCLHCGQPTLPSPSRQQRCPCAVTDTLLNELGQRELEHLRLYSRAARLRAADLSREVWCDGRLMPVANALGRLHHPGALLVLPLRVAQEGLVQVVYFAQAGSRWLKWPFHEA